MRAATLNVVMYHYVRDGSRNRFPRLHSMDRDAFLHQVDGLREKYEMATLEAALAFLAGEYKPRRSLCLLTFDDGVKEHFTDVTPILSSRRIQGLFFVITGCIENGTVAAVHQNHFLTAQLGFARWRELFLDRLREVHVTVPPPESEIAIRTYPWDEESVAKFKYAYNFLIPATIRDRVVSGLFAEVLGDEGVFARDLYVNWAEANQMQSEGMVMGGHTHSHRPLASMNATELRDDLGECRQLLDQRLRPQPITPFSYPYGKRESFTPDAVGHLQELLFRCAFSTENGANRPGADIYAIRRIDCKQAA